MKEEVIAYLKENYTDDKITEMIEEEIVSGNWADADDVEENDCEDEHDYYREFGKGEAEGAILEQLCKEIIEKLKITKDLYKLEVGEELYETVIEVYEQLEDRF